MASSALPLKQLFAKNFDFTPSTRLSRDILVWRTLYENRDTHAEALNTPLLGVFRLKFLPKDSDALFDILSINRSDFTSIIAQSSINTDFIVASDPFNLLCCWAAHKFYTSNLPRNVREETCRAIFFMLLVKFFSSFVGHMLPHGARQDIMEATIDGLSDKFDIKHANTNTWKLIMMARAEELIDPRNIHFNALKTFSTDDRVTYLITDTQTRIRMKIKLVIKEYHETLKHGKRVAESEITEDNLDGEKVVKELKNGFDSMITSVSNRVLNINQFVRSEYVKIACAQSSALKGSGEHMLRELLIKFSTLATYQYQKHKQEEIDKQGNYRGYLVLIRNTIQRTYRACIMNKVKMTSKLDILSKTANLYSASRVNDPEILKVKASVDAFVEEAKISKREATNASLKIAFIVYLIILTFDLD